MVRMSLDVNLAAFFYNNETIECCACLRVMDKLISNQIFVISLKCCKFVTNKMKFLMNKVK